MLGAKGKSAFPENARRRTGYAVLNDEELAGRYGGAGTMRLQAKGLATVDCSKSCLVASSTNFKIVLIFGTIWQGSIYKSAKRLSKASLPNVGREDLAFESTSKAFVLIEFPTPRL